MTRVSDLKNFLEKDFARVSRQYEWDNSGSQIVTEDREIRKAAFSLDPTEKVIDKAIEEGCEVLVTHHPLFFGKVRNLTPSSALGRKVAKAIKADLAILSHHTSLDLADYSLNDHICNLLGAKIEDTLIDEGREEFLKFVVFVPVTHAEAVRKAIADSGAGHIGNYSDVFFSAEGTGRFKPLDGANPFIGTLGDIEEVREERIESIVPAGKLDRLISAVLKAHPYEEVAYDVYPLKNGGEYGLGRIASFDESVSIPKFLDMVRYLLNADSLRINKSDLRGKIKRFAVVTGSGASLWSKCLGKADALVTGDMKHHEAIDALEAGLLIVDAGHFHTEKIFMSYLADKIAEKFEINTVMIDEEPSIINWR